MDISLLLKPVKQGFIDAKKIQEDQSKRSRKALFRIGGFVLKTARRSIRKGTTGPTSPHRLSGQMQQAATAYRNIFGRNPVLQRPSKPGQPPRSFTGKLKAGMNFKVDTRKDTVVVGAVRFQQDGARVLEHGGSRGDAASPFKRLGLVQAQVPSLGLVVGRLTQDGSKIIIGFPKQRAKSKIRTVLGINILPNTRQNRDRAKARPFMGPALDKAQKTILENFRG